MAAKDGVVEDEKILVWEKEDVEYAYRELIDGYKAYVERYKEQNGIEPDIDGVWRSDDFVEEEWRQKLIKAATILENAPDQHWHPESNKRLLDIIHPSHYPIVYGRTTATDGEVIQPPPESLKDSKDSSKFSKQFCWLPSEFKISSDGKTRIASYINNLALPQQEREIYPILEKVFSQFLPLFNHVLADLRRGSHDFRRVKYVYGNYRQGWIPFEKQEKEWKQLLEQFEKGEELTVDFTKNNPPAPPPSFASRMLRKGKAIRNAAITIMLTPLMGSTAAWRMTWKPYKEAKRKGASKITDTGSLSGKMWQQPTQQVLDYVRLEGSTAKVIVKMGTIFLTPKKPKWDGGAWHHEALKV
ncbi:hypothetical protein ABW20_dc0108941 [Dactylellina cionopaga]|nr:hypothetical protein ABW20_dc0108941 [Dactylellina cionopaga]